MTRAKTVAAGRREPKLNEYEREALRPILIRLGRQLSDLSQSQAEALLSLCYNLPHKDRKDVAKVYAGMILSRQALSTVRRHEIGFHAKDPEFLRWVELYVEGNPKGETLEEVKGLRGMLDDLLSFARNGV